jgi:uncharacterized FlgJ-related protein
MIINEEPSPAKRLIAETPQVSNSQLQKALISEMGVVKQKIKGIVFIALIGVSFSLLNNVFLENQAALAKEDNQEKIKKITSEENFNNIIKQNPNDVIENLIIEADKKKKQEIMADKLDELLEGHPMAEMSNLIAEQDEIVAALIVGIGKKESNWGKRSPSKDGKDCYNYWGYKTSGSRGKALGHACFGSPEEAIETIAKRLNHFVYETNRDTPAKMIVWKCGSSCAGHNPVGVNKWISDVQLYYDQVLAFNEIEQLSENIKVAKLGEF